ncbi:hypothetical protein [Marinimicrobium agarilyticum]|uniref:hypothetical protein n=1 Tax=Marinimicrobium agarilyticum TaxID=306546 RepID=UPI0004819F64|nr:hypothetical protein [Marinimicrobium agarilyticum]
MIYKKCLALVLAVVLSGCSGKPSDEDLSETFIQAFAGFEAVGFDMSEYMEPASWEIIDSYEEGNIYVLDAIARIRIKKNIDESEISRIKESLGMHSGYPLQVIRMYELTKKYDAGEITKQDLVSELSFPDDPEGTLAKGDVFSLVEPSEYKFRKTDNGWRAVE